MKKLFLELSFAALCAALLAACGGDSGSSADSLDESSSSSEMDGAESSDSEDLNSNGSEGSEGESSGSGGGESSGSSEELDSSSEGASSSSEEPESSSEEASSSSKEPESSGSEGVEGSSASVPGGSSDASVYDADKNTLKDLRDGQIYKTTTIEVPSKNYSEVWMAKNLNYETDNSWCGGGSGTTEGDCSVYGRLYTWDAAVGRDEDECGYGYECGLGSGEIRGACPKGWHLPSYDEWNALFTAVGGSSTAGSKLKSATGWAWNDYDDISGNGTDAFGFSALPAGYRSSGGDCDDEGNYAGFWSSTEDDGDAAYGMDLDYYGGSADLDYYNKNRGFSVRCLKD
ncbi:MAG: fibrobacter succinogenes major paralogous domain-containing protein [Fibrobacter sp.]|nr:fibrobacter succinogenes major paralogous domain-containing protein [Fibrobacter sp.]